MTLQIAKRELWYRWQYLAHRIGAGNHGPAIPHIMKRRLVRRYQADFGLRVLVETGTYMGDMVAAQLRRFREIHTIELSAALHARAAQRFRHEPHVHVHHGNSAAVLGRVLEALTEPALFWLDAHYSGGITAGSDVELPVLEELKLIFGHGLPGHVVLIDDARCFDGTGGYPSVARIEQNVVALAPGYRAFAESDVVHVLPGAVRSRPTW